MTDQNIPKDAVTLQAKIDLHQARKFLTILGEDEKFTYQTFDDNTKRKLPLQPRVLHGDLDTHAKELIRANCQGSGVFVAVNETDQKGRTRANIIKVRAVFVDLDGTPLDSVMSAPIIPHVVIETSPGKFHAYWAVTGLSLEYFTTVQKRLAEIFKGDKQVCDLPRVMRLPGFFHHKKAPFLTYIKSESSEQPVPSELFLSKFGIILEKVAPTKDRLNDPEAAENGNPYLKALQYKGLLIDQNKSRQGDWFITCPWTDTHSYENKSTHYYEPHTNSYSGHGFKCFHSHCVDKTVNDLKRYLEIHEEDQVVFLDDPLPLTQELMPVAPFTEDLLPEIIRPWVMDCAQRMQVPPDFLGAAFIVVLGALIGRKVAIYPKAFDDWRVIPNLWGAIVGRPSLLKSPAIFEVMKFLDSLAADAIIKHESAVAGFEEDQLWVEAQKASQKEEFKKAARKTGTKERPSLQQIDSPSAPILKRYKTEDATVEKLGEILRDNPQGILLHRDELTGWLRSLDKAGREGDRAFFLESWNGSGSFTIDRIARGTLNVKALCVSILGSIQPGPLAAYVDQATAGGGGDDGLLQRFQIMVWPDACKDWINIDRAPDQEAQEKISRIFKALDAFVPFEPLPSDTLETQTLHFSAEAQKEFDEWRSDLELRLRSGELSPALESHLAKYRSLMPSLALIFYLVKTVGDDLEPVAVDKDSALVAIKWCAYLETHAQRLYSSGEGQGMEAAKALLAKIEAGDLSDGFTLRDVYHRRHWAHLETAEKVGNALKILEEHGWILHQKIIKNCRPSIKIIIHPSIRRKP